MTIYMLDATNVHFVTNCKTLESGVLGNLHAPFGGGLTQKTRICETSAAAYPTYPPAFPSLTNSVNTIRLAC